jgi:hypothetical protein
MKDFEFAGQYAHVADITQVVLTYCVGKGIHEPYRIYLENIQNDQLEEEYENKFSAVRRFIELTEITNANSVA